MYDSIDHDVIHSTLHARQQLETLLACRVNLALDSPYSLVCRMHPPQEHI